MCGIAGYFGKRPPSGEKIEATLQLMENRGPDHQGSLALQGGGNQAVLLHSRLGIIDRDDRSNQPFVLDGCAIVFNGEIYNYVELREKLEKEGVAFKTASDTEVLLRSYLRYGESCVEAFEGMWSFAIYDTKENRLFLSRDRFGEKPLYFLEAEDGFFFGSEIKFIRRLLGEKLEVNRRHLLRYLVNGYKALYKTRETFFERVGEVPYATSVLVGQTLKPVSARFWEPSFRPVEMTLEEAVRGVRERLLESMRIRLRADVPLAFCLSGGVDSAALASIAAKVFGYGAAAFSIIDGDERYNEYENIKKTVDDIGCRHELISIPKGFLLERLRRLVAYHDAPVYTISYYVHSFLSEAISKAGFRVALSGTGADELLTGYYDHFNLHLYEMERRPEYAACLRGWKEKVEPHVRNPHLRNPELYSGNPGFRDHIYLNNGEFAQFLKTDFWEEFTEEVYSENLLRNRMLNELFHEVVPPILHEDDLNSMFYSVENRSPYLDRRFFEFAYSVPSEYLIRDGRGKHLLREAMKGILNEPVRLDPHKKGFNASIHSLLDSSAREREYLLDDSGIFDFFDRPKMEKLLHEDHLPNSYSKFLFCFLNAKIFLEIHS